MGTARSRFVTAVVLLAFLSGAVVSAQEASVLSRWLSESAAHGSYRSVEGQLTELFQEAERDSLPTKLLIRRLNLGAARGLSPLALLDGMREQVRSLKEASSLLTTVAEGSGGPAFLKAGGRAELLNAISIYLNSGLSSALLASLFAAAAQSGRPPERTLQACATLLLVSRLGGATDRELLEFGKSLIDSRVASSSFAAIGSFVIRNAVSGRDSGELLRLTGRILRQGGGLPQMELQLRGRR